MESQKGDLIVVFCTYKCPYLSSIHVFQYRFDFGVLDVLQHDDRMFARKIGEDILEIRRTGGEHHPVALDGTSTVAYKCDVGEGFVLEQLVKNREQI